jgi:hypothetical protein
VPHDTLRSSIKLWAATLAVGGLSLSGRTRACMAKPVDYLSEEVWYDELRQFEFVAFETSTWARNEGLRRATTAPFLASGNQASDLPIQRNLWSA